MQPTHLTIKYDDTLDYILVRIVDNTPHWACGKVECDCDEQYEQLKDDQMRETADDVRQEMVYDDCF